MSNDLMIPDAGGVPDYIRNSQEARQANADAAAGISTGVPPRIKISGKGAFKLVDGNGEEKVYPQGSMIIGPDQNAYMSTIILRARPALRKTWYAGKYNPSEEAGAPDCYSDDGVKPHPSIANPQCDSCEMCKLNAFGTGTDQDGNATAGKACSDTKILAVFVPNKGVHMLKVPPSSLKNFGLFVKQLSNSNIPLGMIMTYIGFDMDVDFPKLVFKFGGWLPAEAVPKVEKLKNSSEVTDIVGGSTGQALMAPKQDDSAAKKKAEAEAAAKKKAEAEAKKKAEAEAAAKKKAEAEATSQDTDDPFGFDLDNTSTTEETQQSSSDPSDEELRAQLGL